MFEIIEKDQESGFYFNDVFVACEVSNKSINFICDNSELILDVLNYYINFFRKFKWSVSFGYLYGVSNSRLSNVFYYTRIFFDEESICICLDFNPNIFKWSYSLSPFLYMTNFVRVSNENNLMSFSWAGIEDFQSFDFQKKVINQEYYNTSIDFKFSDVNDLKLAVCDIEKFLIKIDEMIDEESNGVNFLEEFIFPSEIKIACQQYLIYFAEFLYK